MHRESFPEMKEERFAPERRKSGDRGAELEVRRAYLSNTSTWRKRWQQKIKNHAPWT